MGCAQINWMRIERDRIEAANTLGNYGCEVKTWGKINKWQNIYNTLLINQAMINQIGE